MCLRYDNQGRRKEYFKGGGEVVLIGFFKSVIFALIYSLTLYIGNVYNVPPPPPPPFPTPLITCVRVRVKTLQTQMIIESIAC